MTLEMNLLAWLDTVGNEGSDEDDNSTQALVWENMENYKGQKENFTGNVGPQGAAKHVTEIVDIFYCFSAKN
jgi:cytochrome c556